MRSQPGNSRAVSGIVARMRSDYYDVKLPPRLKVCPNPECPKPERTYAYANKCPFCGTPLEYEEAA